MTRPSIAPHLPGFSTEWEPMLEAAGLDAEEELVYRLLIRSGGSDISSVMGETGLSRSRTGRMLALLETKGLVSRSPGRVPTYVAAPPELALEPLIQQRQNELERARHAARELGRAFLGSTPTGSASDILEIVDGRAAVRQRLNQVVRAASKEFSTFVRPPIRSGAEPGIPLPDQPATGVRCRVIYDTEALSVPGFASKVVDALQQGVVGEYPRVAVGVPLKLAIADRQLALVELGSSTEELGALLIHESPVLNAMVSLFELYWERSIPFGKEATSDAGEAFPVDRLRPEDRHLLMLMSGGVTDVSIAREMGVGLSTVTRRLRRAMNALGVTTRFQAGLVLGERGWLTYAASGATPREPGPKKSALGQADISR